MEIQFSKNYIGCLSLPEKSVKMSKLLSVIHLYKYAYYS
jgi:hypothetical protein